MEFIKSNPECRILYTWYHNVNEKGEITKLRKPLTCKNQEHLQYCLIYTQVYDSNIDTFSSEKLF